MTKFTTKTISFTLGVLCVLTTLTACGGSSAPPRRFFSLAPSAPQPARVTAPPTLRVRELDCAAPYDQSGIVFRVSPVEVRS